MFSIFDLVNFLNEHIEEWWTPYEIGQELEVDTRTVKNVIRRLDRMTHNGWVLDISERTRIYAVRMVRDLEGSESLKKTEISEVEDKQNRNHTSPKKQTLLFEHRRF